MWPEDPLVAEHQLALCLLLLVVSSFLDTVDLGFEKSEPEPNPFVESNLFDLFFGISWHLLTFVGQLLA